MDLATWRFTINDGPRPVASWTWAEFEALPQTTWRGAIHCVTKWSKFDTTWSGVTPDDDLPHAAGIAPPSAYLLAQSHDDYDTNLPVADLVGGQAMVATRFAGAPIEAEHGGPARLLVPHLYFWKSAKWIKGLRFTARDEAGFWELRGCHMVMAIPCAEQRHTNDPASARICMLHRCAGAQAVIERIVPRTPRIVSVFLQAPLAHCIAGQHVDVRLTADDGYQAQRSYLIASPPGGDVIELGHRAAGGWRGLAYFHEIARPGRHHRVARPIGGHYFSPRAPDGGPVLLVGGGSGVVPLVAIVRDWSTTDPKTPVMLVHSARTWDELAFRDELLGLEVRQSSLTFVTITTRGPGVACDGLRPASRTPALLREVLMRWGFAPRHVYVRLQRIGSKPRPRVSLRTACRPRSSAPSVTAEQAERSINAHHELSEIWLAAGVSTPLSPRSTARWPGSTRSSLSVPVVRHMIDQLHGAAPDFAVWGTVVPNLTWSNIAREVLMDAGVAPTIPAFSTVMACSTSMVAAIEAAGMIDGVGRNLGARRRRREHEPDPARPRPIAVGLAAQIPAGALAGAEGCARLRPEGSATSGSIFLR